jgi:hypothetical protein
METTDIYKEIGINYRHFNGWRDRVLAGHLIVVSGLAIAVSWALTHEVVSVHSWLISTMGVLTSISFWALEHRNRALWRACMKTGAKIEEAENIAIGNRMYSALDASRDRKVVTHSAAMNFIFFSSAAFFAVVAIFLFLHPPMSQP